MDYSGYKAIHTARDGAVLTVSLNRPHALNAIDGQLHEELSRIFIDIADDDEAAVVVLTGAGKTFCAGGDVAWLQQMADAPETFEKTAYHGKRIVFSMLDCAKPVVARLNGAAVGLGATIALLSDIIIAEEIAVIADPHVRVGLVAGDGGAVIWPQLVGYARAKEYLFTGNKLPAREAERIGLINRVVAPESLDAAVYDLAHALAGGARIAIQGTKKTVNIGLKQLAHSIMDASLSFESESNLSRDHREGIASFLEKRPPRFTGR